MLPVRRVRGWVRWGLALLFIVAAGVFASTSQAGYAGVRGCAQPADHQGAWAVIQWNRIALRTSAAAPFDPPREARALALVHTAVFNAVNAIRHVYPPYGVAPAAAPPHASVEAAVAAAAHDTLVSLYPDQRASLQTQYGGFLAGLACSPDELTTGSSVGHAASAALLAWRSGDGSGASAAGVAGGWPGQWRPTPPAFRPALEPGWGRVRPFLMASPAQFRPGPPPPLTSSIYARDLSEIAALGRDTSSARTPEQAQTARFWVATAPQLWNQVVQQLTSARGMEVTTAARAFALLNLAGADTFIASWDAKFAYRQWRPITGIREAGTDGNPATIADPTWTAAGNPTVSGLPRRAHGLCRSGRRGPEEPVRCRCRQLRDLQPHRRWAHTPLFELPCGRRRNRPGSGLGRCALAHFVHCRAGNGSAHRALRRQHLRIPPRHRRCDHYWAWGVTRAAVAAMRVA